MNAHRVSSLNSHDGLLRAQVSSAGGILTSLTYQPAPGCSHAIFHRAHWLDDPIACAGQPPLMRRLAGEWVGVPFGHSEKEAEGYFSQAPHGLPVNGQWEMDDSHANHIRLTFNYPDDYPLARLQRTITLADNGEVDFSLTIAARRSCRFPVGLHPIFPVGGEAGEVRLSAENLQQGIVYPTATEPNISQLQPLARFTDLAAVPALNGATANLSRLPLPFPTEEIVQLLSPVSGIKLHYPTRQITVSLHWDTQWLPHCLLWFSNGGRAMPPWDGKNHCLGVEPVCSAWDLGPGSRADNPISDLGYETSLALTPDQPITIGYRIRCQTA
ncbi:hypothetical protein V2I52_04200 [Brenneria sp. g21c3]|uniref:aldose epimerase family protein n=1 Tax=Brenneria sp. g21c3 TaxID=3093893 RepID=UPI002EAD257E|nr:hypothetical protein [Brenneria sp. g21c3]